VDDGTGDAALADLIQAGRPAPAEPERLGRHDVLVERAGLGTSVYLVKHGRVLTFRAVHGYREDVAEALLDAVADLMADDQGPVVWLRPLSVPGFRLDRAALLGPGETDFFARRPGLAERGLQVVPVHRSEAADGESAAEFRWAVFGRGLGLRAAHWDREPEPRAVLVRGLRRPATVRARTVLDRDAPALLDGRDLCVRDMRGHELRLVREWDRLRGTLIEAGGDPLPVDVPRLGAWAALGPLFLGADPADVVRIAPGDTEPMLEIRVADPGRGRADVEMHPETLDACLAWVRALTPENGAFLVFAGRSAGVVQMVWEDDGLWLETPEPERRRSRGRHVTLDEAERMVEILARDDRVAVDELGGLTEISLDV
jgi:hypothetical protein